MTTPSSKRHMRAAIANLAAATLCSMLTACGGGGQSSTPPPIQPQPPVLTASTAYYVNCTAPSNGDGTQTNPWNSLATPNAVTFLPGDQLLFLRGTTCSGMLAPAGSGTDAVPIVIGAYGAGALPILDGGTSNLYALELNSVQYYEVQNLAIRGGTRTAVYVLASGANMTYEHIHMANLDVSSVNHIATTRGDGGGIQFNVTGAGSRFDDVLINGVTVHDLTASQGIDIEGPYSPLAPAYNSNVTIENSTVHDVYGDGILLGEASGAVLQNNVVYRSGLCANCTGSTPVGLWNWFSNGVTARNNESYDNQTWAAANTDGGDFDIDMWNQNATYEYNYGHGSQGYCFLIEGYENLSSLTSIPATSNSIVRYNVCAGNVTRDTGIGEILIYAFGNGLLDGVQVYNNTIYVSGVPGTWGLIQSNYNNPVIFTGTTSNFVKNNLIYSSKPYMISTTTPMTLDNNLYWNNTGSAYNFIFNGTPYTSLAAYQQATGQDAHAVSADPLLNGAGYAGAGMPTLSSGDYTLQSGSPALGAGTDVCAAATDCITGNMGAQDFFGQPLSSTHNIGAFD